jgi:uncharacterized protein
MPNRLARESSPYLLQHANNPVDWYAWGEEAFERARVEDKPIFLSVGYSTCHWCHVMEHESFENGQIAALLNAHFVSIKVDREERPDVDRVYMLFVQATTGAGGWPMSVWLTPELRPFFGGTYFPPTARWGRAGFADVLTQLAQAWRDQRQRVLETAVSLTTRLHEASATSSTGVSPTTVAEAETLASGAQTFRRAFDARFGGFGGAPKFPRPSELLFLLREHARAGDPDLLDMVLQTLRAMALGGMRDHLGGGFHRYSVDAAWHVPHFEKMLYDQAQLVIALVEAAQITGDPFWASVADDTLTYIRRNLTHPEGGFYSAEDADSIPPEAVGQPGAKPSEGAFYLWSADEIERLLGADAGVVKRRFGVQPRGNVAEDPQGEFGTKNILYVDQPIEDVALRSDLTPVAVLDALERARVIMFAARNQRPRPRLDDKVLTAWNGLMIAACARASRGLVASRDDAGGRAARLGLDAGRSAARFIRARLWNQQAGTLQRRFRDGRAGVDAYCEDYAYLVWGLLELFQADGEPDWLRWAIQLQDRQNALFWDDAEGGWFSTTGTDASVLLRLKEDYDGAEPAAGSIAALNELVLAHLVGGDDRRERAARTLARFGPRLGEMARSVPMMACALEAWHAALQQVVVVGEPDDPSTRALHDAISARYLPFAIVVPVTPGEPQRQVADLLPWIAAMSPREGRATAYMCQDFACQEPVTSPEALGAQLDRLPVAPHV